MEIQLETSRLFIRPPKEDDLTYFQRWLADAELTKHVGGIRSPERIEQTFQFILKNWKEWGFGTAMIVWKENNEVIGSCGINRVMIDGNTEYDLGYLVTKNYWGKGVASEASKAVLDYVINKFQITRVTAWPNLNNVPSVRVVEKLGFKYEKTFSKEHAGTVLTEMCLYSWAPPLSFGRL